LCDRTGADDDGDVDGDGGGGGTPLRTRKAGSILFLGRLPSGKYCAYEPWTKSMAKVAFYMFLIF